MTFTNSRLMKCPFCGGDAEIVLEDFENGYVHCTECGAERPIDKERMLYATFTAFRNVGFITWNERPAEVSENECDDPTWYIRKEVK